MNFKANVLAQLKDVIPEKIKGNVGADIYQNYTRLRTAMLGAEVNTFGDTYKIQYATVIKGRKERIVFLHGFADCKENFFDAAHFLAPYYDLLIPDLPGFGRSFRKKSETYDLEHYAEWLVELFQHLGWNRFHLIGNSLGGAIAAEIAIRYPNLVQSLTLIDPAGIVEPDKPSIYDEFLDDRIIFEIHSPFQFEYFLNRVFQNPPLIPPLVKDFLYRDFARHSKWNRKILFDLLQGIKSMKERRFKTVVLNGRLKDIAAPTLILWGEKDSFFPASTGHLVRRSIPDSKLHFLPGLGHSPQIEAPFKVTRLIKTFLSDLSKREA